MKSTLWFWIIAAAVLAGDLEVSAVETEAVGVKSGQTG